MALRGGRRRNLTSLMKKRIAVFHDGWPTLVDAVSRADTALPGGRRFQDSNGRGALATVEAAKLEDRNISAASRILCSDDTTAPINEETLELLRQKHPAPPPDRPAILCTTSSAPFQTTELIIQTRLRSFPMDWVMVPIRTEHSGEPDA